MKKLVATVAMIAASGCSRYSDFTLPVQSAPAHGEVSLHWDVRPTPVLAKGSPGEFDSTDALNPSVVHTAAGYFNFYSGYDG